MDACKECGKDMERQGTHWDGCHTDHPECAAYKAGFRAGMRAAAEIANAMHIGVDAFGGIDYHVQFTREAISGAILAEADK